MKMRFILIALVLASLASCGFHIRGGGLDSTSSSFQNIIKHTFYIQANSFNIYANSLRKTLSSYGTTIVSDEQDAD